MSLQPPDFTVRLVTQESEHVVVVSGEIDLNTAPRLQHRITSLLDVTDCDVVVDMAEVAYVDSTGMSVLLTAQECLRRRDRQLVLRNPSSPVLLLLDVCAVANVFVIRDDPSAFRLDGEVRASTRGGTP